MTEPKTKDPSELEADRLKRLAVAQKAREDRQQAEERAREDRLIEAEELAASLATLGTRGVDFQIVSNPHGVFAIRKPDSQAIRIWEQASEKKKLSLEWMISYLRHYIEPKDRGLLWCQISAQRPGLLWATSTVFLELMGVDVHEQEKK